MPNDNNASIRYLMKEMDPSEEVLIERSMMEDEDLLIEVESMRQTLRRLEDNLPEKTPPQHLTASIIRQAAEQKRQNQTGLLPRSLGLNRLGYAAAAAIFAIGIVSGALIYEGVLTEETRSDQATGNAASIGMPGTIIDSSDLPIQMTPVTRNSAGQSAPWVDRNDIIRFQDQFNETTRAEYDSILNTATEKLRPLNDQFQGSPTAPTLQLTGSE